MYLTNIYSVYQQQISDTDTITLRRFNTLLYLKHKIHDLLLYLQQSNPLFHLSSPFSTCNVFLTKFFMTDSQSTVTNLFFLQEEGEWVCKKEERRKSYQCLVTQRRLGVKVSLLQPSLTSLPQRIPRLVGRLPFRVDLLFVLQYPSLTSSIVSENKIPYLF